MNSCQVSHFRFSEKGPARGLPWATPKATVWMPKANITQPDLLDRGVPRIQETWYVLLGSTEFVEEKIGKRMEKVEQINDKLPLLQDAQT